MAHQQVRSGQSYIPQSNAIPPSNSGRQRQGNQVSSASLGQGVPKKPRKRKKSSAKHFDNALSDVFLAAAIVSLPMLALSGVFIGLVYRWRVDISTNDRPEALFSKSQSLTNNSRAISTAYFVSIESARLVTIASWTSTVISFLPPWVTMLYSYHLAGSFLDRSTKKLPTPYQMWLILETCEGNYSSIWSWLTYRLSPSRPNKRDRSNVLVATTSGVLIWCIIMGLCILLADTWLHLTTTTVLLQQNEPSVSPSSSFSRILAPKCIGGDRACTLEPTHISQGSTRAQYEILDAAKAYRTLFNTSMETSVLSTVVDGRQLSFYASAQVPGGHSYRASTYAVNTQCTAMSRACNLRQETVCPASLGGHCTNQEQYGWGTPFRCSSALHGDLTQGEVANVFNQTQGNPQFFSELL